MIKLNVGNSGSEDVVVKPGVARKAPGNGRSISIVFFIIFDDILGNAICFTNLSLNIL